MTKFQALGSALALALAGTMISAPAMARTHHPSTKAEKAQTRDLNMQQLAIAQGQAPANQQAMNGGAQPQPQEQQPAQNQNQNVPADQMTNGGQTAQAPAQPAPVQQPAPTPAPTNQQQPSGN